MENENFPSFRKVSKINFSLKVGPFIIKNKVSLLVVEGLFRDMNFKNPTKINYDPHHITSHRRQHNKNKSFEHQEIEGLADRYNLMDYQSDMEDSGNLLENASATMKETTMIVPTPNKIEINGKRIISEAMEFEEEDSKASKRKKNKVKERVG